MTTNGAPPPARVQLTPGSWVGIAGIAATLLIALLAGAERVSRRRAHARIAAGPARSRYPMSFALRRYSNSA